MAAAREVSTDKLFGTALLGDDPCDTHNVGVLLPVPSAAFVVARDGTDVLREETEATASLTLNVLSVSAVTSPSWRKIELFLAASF